MTTTVKCKHCGNLIEVDEAISKQLEEKVVAENQAKHQMEIENIRRENSLILEKAREEIKEKAISEAQKAYEAKIKLTKEEAEDKDKQNKELQNQLSEVLKQLRSAKDAEARMKVEFEKKLLLEQENIKLGAKKEVEDELNLKMAEKDKKITDMEKQVQEMKRKLEQGSQQTQGEVQELHLEEKLKMQFPFDEIKEVPKGVKGADIIQVVKTRSGMTCGIIVWESKNTKNWSSAWVQKLIEDQRSLKAELAVLVSSVLPEEIKSFGQMDKIWVSDVRSAISLAQALRAQLMGIFNAQEANKGKATKAEAVYEYLISNDFKQRIEVWVEYFRNRQEEITKERTYFTKKWEKEEKNLLKVLENTAGIYGDLQGVIGTALPKIDYLELPEENDQEINDEDRQNSLPLL